MRCLLRDYWRKGLARLRITKAAVDAATAGTSDAYLWDELLAGFGLKVTPSGTKTYLVQYRAGGRGSKTRRVTIGRHGSPWTPAAARTEAERLLFAVSSGADPQADKLAKRQVDIDLSFSRYAARYLNDYGRRNWRPRTWSAVESNLRRFAIPVLADKPINMIARADLVRVFDGLPRQSPALPRNIFAHLRRLFSWAEERGDLDRSPFTNMRSPPSVASRERVLTDHEIRTVWSATHAQKGNFPAIVRLLLLTGQRRDEVAAMRWEELHRSSAEWRLPGARTKNARDHLLPLTDAIISELDSVADGSDWPRQGWVFTTTGASAVSGFSRAKSRLDQLASLNNGAPITAWRLHDLRRTMATGLQKLGVRFEVTEALLNHLGGARAGIAGVYQRHDWRTEKRHALTLWNAHISAMVGGATSSASPDS